MMHKIRSFALAACLILSAPAYSLEIILEDTTAGGSPAEVLAAFEAAAAIWESTFTDDVTVRVLVGYESLGPGILGQAGSASVVIDYTTVRSAMMADATSAFDATAIGSLESSSDFEFAVRGVNPVDAGTVYGVNDTGFGLSEWNTTLSVNTANAKALGLRSDDGSFDAAITFSSDFTFDFDPSDGIDAGAFDFIGVAAHEIGHALGFVSGVDFLDFFTYPAGPGCCFANTLGDNPDTDFQANTILTTLDLFRYSEFTSTVEIPGFIEGGLRDMTFGEFGPIYLSLDGGLTALGTMSTGAFNGLGSGGGRQASHWEDLLGLGLMDPTAGFGELLGLTDLDRIAFDAIGWDLVGATRVPEPGTLSLLLLGLGGLLARRRMQKV